MIIGHDILGPFQDDDAPHVGMVGWCSRFWLLRHVIYEWSQNFLKLGKEFITLNDKRGPLPSMVFLSARSVRHDTIQEAIYIALWCRRGDKKCANGAHRNGKWCPHHKTCH